LESFFEVNDEVVGSLRLNYNIIDVSLDILADLVLEALLDSPLVGGAGVFWPKGHGGEAIGTEGDLVFLL